MAGLVRELSSPDNPALRRAARLAQDPGASRETGMVWLEGEHLCSAFLDRAGRALQAFVAASAWDSAALSQMARTAAEVLVLPDRLFARLSSLPSPAGLAFVVPRPAPSRPDPSRPAVLLDRLQDAGNVGSILRTAAAFGVPQVWALRGTAGLWSPKVLRAGMGSHFGLALAEGLSLADLGPGGLPWVGTSLQATCALPAVSLPAQAIWAFGHEGRGLDEAVLARCALTVRIPQPGGEESLNVAAAAAVCLYESLRRGYAIGSPT
jgi:TrmH family RNA methyltransferase